MGVNAQRIAKTFYDSKSKLQILADISFDTGDNEFVSIVGPNGCGKTTFLNIVLGLEEATAGRVIADGRPTVALKAGVVFQDYKNSLYPWKTVAQNIALATPRGESRRQQSRLENIMKKTGLWPHRGKYPYQLSGGLSQLASIARAVVFSPDIFVLDEPFSALDYQTSVKIQKKFLELWQENPKTTLFVSHSIEEAIFLSDKIIIFSKPPTRVLQTITVNLPRPRELEMLVSQQFMLTKAEVLKWFKGYL